MMKYILVDGVDGTTVSLFKAGLPRTVTLSDKTPQKILKFLYEQGSNLVKEKNGNDNQS